MKALVRICILFLLLVMVQSAIAQEEMPALGELETGWTTLMPGGDTMCSVGTPYEFHVRPGSTDNLLIFFNGGGACWFGEACDLESEPNIHVPIATTANNPEDNGGTGIFDLSNEENPFLDYSMVFLPYCTGDVFTGGGAQTYTYGDDNKEVTTYHHGVINTTAVLDWVFANFEDPQTVVVTGSSAGSLGSAFHTGTVAEQYPDADIVHLGDGAGGYRSPGITNVWIGWRTMEVLPDWEAYADETPETFRFEDIYIATENRFDNVTIAQYNSAEDETQYGFNYVLGETDFTLPEKLFLNQSEIRAGTDGNFATYMASGSEHTILRFPYFYTYEEEGVRFVDWVRDLINGEDVPDVACNYFNGECQSAPGE